MSDNNDYHKVSKTIPKISIIIPYFNSAAYLNECLDSINIYDASNVEVILINDGSTDNGKSIVDQHNQVTKHHQQSNAGQSAARNKGLELATGEYVMFLDSDDSYNKNALDVVYKIIQNCSVDFLFFESDVIFDDVEKSTEHSSYGRPSILYNKTVSSIDFFNTCVFSNQYNVSPCMFTARRIYMKGITFPVGVTSEDNLFTTRLLLENPLAKVLVVPEKIYRRRIRKNSLVTMQSSFHLVNSYFFVAQQLSKMKSDVSADAMGALRLFTSNIVALALKSTGQLKKGYLKQSFFSRWIVLVSILKGDVSLTPRIFIGMLSPKLYSYLVPLLKRVK